MRIRIRNTGCNAILYPGSFYFYVTFLILTQCAYVLLWACFLEAILKSAELANFHASIWRYYHGRVILSKFTKFFIIDFGEQLQRQSYYFHLNLYPKFALASVRIQIQMRIPMFLPDPGGLPHNDKKLNHSFVTYVSKVNGSGSKLKTHLRRMYRQWIKCFIQLLLLMQFHHFQVSNTEENLAAVVRLLSLVIKKVPPEILISRYIITKISSRNIPYVDK